jgi:queuine tRNA-ribosyltransferase
MKTPLKFTIQKTLPSRLARTGVISTPHGESKTPALIAAATKATVKALTFDQLDALGAESILVNTYHLLLQPGLDILKTTGGLHNFINYQKPIFSDSGGFQIMSLPNAKIDRAKVTFRSHLDGAKLEMTPKSSMQAQHLIGSDLHIAFDCPIGYGNTDTSRLSAEKSLAITHDWAKICLQEHQKLNHEHQTRGEPPQALLGVVQGGQFPDLRTASAAFLANLPFDGYAIGGMYSAKEGENFLPLINKILPNAKPRHWLGMGAEPRDFFVGIEHGVDTFDCVAATRQARNGALYTKTGRINIKNAKYKTDFTPIDPDCHCYTCRHHTKAYLHHLFKAGEISAATLATIHNEYFSVNLVRQIRQSLETDTFQEFKTAFLTQYYRK